MVYTVTCNPALDYVMVIPDFRGNGVERSTAESLTYGGKGINVSAVLTRLGVPSTALGFAGGFTGEKLRSLLDEDGIVHDFIELPTGDTRINVKIKADKELDLNAGGPPVPSAAVDALLRRLDTLTDGDALVLAGAISKNLPSDLYRQMLDRPADKQVLFAVDAETALLQQTLPYRPFLVKPNHHELGALFGMTLTETGEIERCARKLQQMGARNVLVSRAADGALLVDETGACHTVEAVSGTVVNSVGCGDSMVAGFLAGWLKTRDYPAALRLGAACGSATAFSPMLATKAEIDACLAQLQK